MRRTSIAFLASLLIPAALAAQYPQPDSTKPKPDSVTPAAKPAAAPAPAPAPTLNFSGVVFGNYQYHGEAANKAQNKFDLERAYLTFRMPAGDRASIRVTADVFQQTSSTNNADSFYKGWVLRAKYAYLQYDYLKGKSTDWTAVARIGLVHTMFIDHEENFWPRWLSQTPVERAGFFSSADAGIATIVTIPNKYGEVYAAITNGPGYASRETDRFKDYQARLTLTPLGNSDVSYLRTFAVDGWVYRGAIASKFVNGGAGQVGRVGSGLDRNRWGLFAGIRDPRLTAGFDYAQRSDQGEGSSLNTLASPRTVTDSTGRLLSAYAVVKPFQIANASSIPLGIVFRWDNVKPNTSIDAHYNVIIGGLTWDLSKKSSISLDYQEQTPKNTTAIAPTRIYFLHWVANF
jgi:hypothetical protein